MDVRAIAMKTAVLMIVALGLLASREAAGQFGDVVRPAAPLPRPVPLIGVDETVRAWRAQQQEEMELRRLVQAHQAANAAVAMSASAEAPSASLRTNPEFERLLDRADQIVAAGRADLAPVLWQRVLDEGTGSLATQFGGTEKTFRHTYHRYRPLHEETEQRIVSAGPAALAAYQLQADGEARGILNGTASPERERALSAVATRYFLSTLGDDAVFELACLRLERGEFAAAAQLLMKLERHPKSDVPPEAVATRLSVALARLGKLEEATGILAAQPAVPEPVRAALDADFQLLSSGNTAAFASPGRTTLMPDVSGADAAHELAEAWEYVPRYTLKGAPPGRASARRAIIVMDGRQVAVTVDASGRMVTNPTPSRSAPDLNRDELAALWRASARRPAGELLFAGDRVLLRAEDRVVCCDAATGEVRWMGRKTRFPFTGETARVLQLLQAGVQVSGGARRQPNSLTGLLLFGDRVPQRMTLTGDMLLGIEGELDIRSNREPANEQVRNPFGLPMQGGSTGRENQLAAYDVSTGKLLWSRHASEGGGEKVAGGFLAAPLPVGELLIAATTDGTRLNLSGLERATGSTVWTVPLCDVPPGGLVWSAPVGLAADKGTVYVAPGAGAVAAVDALSGSLHGVVSYPRSLASEPMDRLQVVGGVGRPVPADRRGARVAGGLMDSAAHSESEENFVLPHDDLVVVMASDFGFLFALDAQTGALRWEAPLAPGIGGGVEYCLGIRRGKLFAAGNQVVRRYDLAGGRMEWERPLAVSLGRGLLTETTLYLPENGSILRIDPDSGETLETMSAGRPEGEPAGNLYSDGRRLYMVGAARVCALEPAASRSEGDNE